MKSVPRELPRLYAILDAEATAARKLSLLAIARELRDAGVLLLQYRDKVSSRDALAQNALQIRDIFSRRGATLILNDDPELCVEAGWDGVHVGQTDVAAAAARAVVGPHRLVGVSTHTPEQVSAASLSGADYVAVGPVFATRSKSDAEAPVGLGGVAAARLLTDRPLVAIGGINVRQAPAVIEAGADSVAVIGALLGASDSPPGSTHAQARKLLVALSGSQHKVTSGQCG